MIKIYQTGILPLGHFDIKDTDLPNILGGEILVFDLAQNSADERRTPDTYSDIKRSYLRLATSADSGPFFLANSDKNSGDYSSIGLEKVSMFSTATSFAQQYDSSSKISIFGAPGFYSITIDVVEDGYITESTIPNTPLYSSDSGLFTTLPNVTNKLVAYFIEYRKSSIVNNNLNRPFYTAGSFPKYDSIIIYKPY